MKMMSPLRSNLLGLIMIACLCLAVGQASAQTHEAIFSGTLHTLNPARYDGSVTFGTPFTVIFRYDSATPTWFTDSTVRQGYEATTLPSYSYVSFGNYAFTTEGFRTIVYNDYDTPYDGFRMFSSVNVSTVDDGFRVISGGLIASLYSTNTALFTSTALSAIETTYAVSNFDVAGNDLQLFLAYGDGFSSGASLYGTVTSYSVSAIAVPEPSTYAAWLGAAALGGVVLWRRRERRVA